MNLLVQKVQKRGGSKNALCTEIHVHSAFLYTKKNPIKLMGFLITFLFALTFVQM